jgi:hypothetical protein
MDIGVEIITVDKKLKSFNLLTTKVSTEFFKQLENFNKAYKANGKEQTIFKLIKNLKTEFQQEEKELQSNWMDGTISNQEFLLKINKYASRSYNDTTAYPIFPWIFSDFSIDINTFEKRKNKTTLYRDFGKHTALFTDKADDDEAREDKEEELKEKYQEGLKSAKKGKGNYECLFYGERPYMITNGLSVNMHVMNIL